ncbi:MAG TPA: hypothetical protein VF164_10915 [Trueperaceae bacterium]
MRSGAVVNVDRMVHGGVALARLDTGEVVLVAGALPGEVVAVALERRKGVLRGTTTEVIEPSAHRVDAPSHPGLDYGHIAYGHQLELKREVVDDALRRAFGVAGVDGGSSAELQLPSVPPVVPSPQVWGYRNVVQPAVHMDGGHGVRLGYRRRGTGEVVPLASDPVATPAANAAFGTVRDVLDGRRGSRSSSPRVDEVVIRANDEGESLVALVGPGRGRAALDLGHELVRAGVTGVAWAESDPRGRFRRGVERLAGKRTVLQRFNHLSLSVSATTFSQPNPLGAAALYRELTSWAGSGDAALDLYAGGGAIAFHLADTFSSVTALEVERGAVARGEADAARLGINNVSFVRADAGRLDPPTGVELVVVDPPRAGLSAGLRDTLTGATFDRLIYVSCDAATWARDVADMHLRGLRLRQVLPYDLYPHTHHVEILSLLERIP